MKMGVLKMGLGIRLPLALLVAFLVAVLVARAGTKEVESESSLLIDVLEYQSEAYDLLEIEGSESTYINLAGKPVRAKVSPRFKKAAGGGRVKAAKPKIEIGKKTKPHVQKKSVVKKPQVKAKPNVGAPAKPSIKKDFNQKAAGKRQGGSYGKPVPVLKPKLAPPGAGSTPSLGARPVTKKPNSIKPVPKKPVIKPAKPSVGPSQIYGSEAQRKVTVPSSAKQTLDHIRKNGAPPKGYMGGREFKNDGRLGGQVLPKKDAKGRSISYKEYDVKPFKQGVNRGAERIVLGSNGKAYYTRDHYKTFTPVN